jgi:hypothetical protein
MRLTFYKLLLVGNFHPIILLILTGNNGIMEWWNNGIICQYPNTPKIHRQLFRTRRRRLRVASCELRVKNALVSLFNRNSLRFYAVNPQPVTRNRFSLFFDGGFWTPFPQFSKPDIPTFQHSIIPVVSAANLSLISSDDHACDEGNGR